MAFGSNINKSAQQQETETENTGEVKGENTNDFLNPKKDAKKDAMHDPYKEELTKKSAYQYTLKTLNAIKIVSPIITALMQRPGLDAPNEEISESFRTLIKEISKASEDVCLKIGVDPTKEKNFWIRNVLEKSFANIIKEQWVTKGEVSTDQITGLIDQIIEFSNNVSESTDYEDISVESLLKLSNIKAFLPILNEAHGNFNLYRDLEKDIEPIMTKLRDVVAQSVDKIADDYANKEDRAKIYNILIQEAGQLYATSWHAEGKRIQDIMKNYNPDKLEKSLERYKASGGLPLDKVEHDFDKYFSKMIIISEKLVSSQKAGLDKKMKIKN